jgi:hypothetical protein
MPDGAALRGVDNVYFFRLADGRIIAGWEIEDSLSWFGRLGLPPS